MLQAVVCSRDSGRCSAEHCNYHHCNRFICARQLGTVDGLPCFLLTNFNRRRKHMLKYMTAGVAASALLASVAFAQTPAATGDRANMAPATASDSALKGSTWRTSKVVGLSVYNDSNEKLGSINDLLMDKSGNIKAVVLGVGGFLGMGEHLVAVPLDKVKFSSEPIVYTGTASTGAPSGGGSMMKPPPTTPPTSTTTGSAGAGG